MSLLSNNFRASGKVVEATAYQKGALLRVQAGPLNGPPLWVDAAVRGTLEEIREVIEWAADNVDVVVSGRILAVHPRRSDNPAQPAAIPTIVLSVDRRQGGLCRAFDDQRFSDLVFTGIVASAPQLGTDQSVNYAARVSLLQRIHEAGVPIAKQGKVAVSAITSDGRLAGNVRHSLNPGAEVTITGTRVYATARLMGDGTHRTYLNTTMTDIAVSLTNQAVSIQSTRPLRSAQGEGPEPGLQAVS